MRIFVISFDRLPAASLGCYGAMFLETPHFDELAATGFVCDNYFIDMPDRSLRDAVLNLGVPFLCITDAPADAADHPPHVEAGTIAGLQRLGEQELKAALGPWIRESPARVVWINAGQPVLSTVAFQQALGCWTQEKIDSPPELTTSTGWLALDDLDSGLTAFTASRRRLIRHTALVIEQDRFLARLLDVLQSHVAGGDLLLVTSAAGDRLACREERPDWLESVSEPVAHLPLLIRSGVDAPWNGGRVDRLLQGADIVEMIAATLDADRFDLANWIWQTGQVEITYASETATAIRTRDWLAVRRHVDDQQEAGVRPGDEPEVRLYRKPEDVWEILDVASQFPDLIERLLSTGRLSDDAM